MVRDGEAIILEIQAIGGELGISTPYSAKIQEVARMCSKNPEIDELFRELVKFEETVLDD